VPPDPAASRPEPIVPAGPPRVDVAEGAQSIAIVEPERIVVAGLPDLVGRCEIGVDPDATSCAAVFLGAERMLVTSSYAAHTLAYLIDPIGPRKLAEVRIESPVRVLAVSGDRALVAGAVGTAIIAAVGDGLEVSRLPLRTEPTCAAGFGGGRFVINTSGSFEEWHGVTRAPIRRLRMARLFTARTMGYGAGHVWWIANSDPTKIEILPTSNRGQPRTHVLPEAIARAAGHPDVGVALAIGADSRRVYVVDLVGATPPVQLASGEADDVAIAIGKTATAVIVAQGRAPELVALDVQVRPATVAIAGAAPIATALDEDVAPDGDEEMPTPPPVPPPKKSAAKDEPSLAQRLTEWRDRMKSSTRGGRRPLEASHDGAPTWRDDLVAWSRGVVAGAHRDPQSFAPGSPLASLDRLGLGDDLLPAIALAYAMHLSGVRGVAPVDLARLLGYRWNEALGNGVLASSGALRWRGARVVLAPAVTAFLDERPAITGTLFGAPRDVSLVASSAVVSSRALDDIALLLAPQLGAVLVPRALTPAVWLESKLRGAIALVDQAAWLDDPAPGLSIVRANSADDADAIGLPVLATL